MHSGPTGLPTWIEARRGRHSACRGDEVPRSPSHLGSAGPEGRHYHAHRLAAVATGSASTARSIPFLPSSTRSNRGSRRRAPRPWRRRLALPRKHFLAYRDPRRESRRTRSVSTQRGSEARTVRVDRCRVAYQNSGCLVAATIAAVLFRSLAIGGQRPMRSHPFP
jgi:hypothetical protein